MRRLAPALLALTLSCNSAGQSPPPPPTNAVLQTAPSTTTPLQRVVSVGQWEEDVEVLVARLEDVHPDAFWRIGRPEFDRIVSDIRGDLTSLSDEEVMMELSRLTATIDGHTHLLPIYQRAFPQPMLPLQLYLFDDGVFVVDASSPHRQLIGAEVTSIGYRPVSDVIDLVLPYLQYDNDQTRRWLAPLLLVAPGVLDLLGISGAEQMTLRTPGGTEEVVSFSGEAASAPSIVGNFTVGLPSRDDTLYLENRDLAFWAEYLDESDTAYMQYNFVQPSSARPDGTNHGLSDLVSDVNRMVEEMAASRIVIDLRHNPGGNNFTYPVLLDWLQEQTLPIYVIIGRNTFSAAMNFATEVDQTTGALFVGEATGGSPNLYGDTRSIILPNSKLVAHISSRYWEKSTPDDDRPSIIPDVEVPVTAEHYFSGHDAALAAILATAP